MANLKYQRERDNTALVQLIPTSGMNNASRDDNLITAEQRFFRDIVNADVTPEGNLTSRDDFKLLPDTKGIEALWQNSVDGSVWSISGGKLYKNILGEEVADVGVNAQFIELNGQSMVLASNGLFADGVRVTLDAPPTPTVTLGQGSLPSGDYGVALSHIDPQTYRESPLSNIRRVNVPDECSITVNGGTDTVAYITHPNGKELFRLSGGKAMHINEIGFGARPAFISHLPFGDGDYLSYWKGRLVVAEANLLKFSDALGYHVMNVYDYVAMPQDITFIEVTDFGMWVGMQSSVAFITGNSIEEMALSVKETPRPVAGSSVRTETGTIAWLSEKGYCIGRPDGQIEHVHIDNIKGIIAKIGSSTFLNNRIYSVVH